MVVMTVKEVACLMGRTKGDALATDKGAREQEYVALMFPYSPH